MSAAKELEKLYKETNEHREEKPKLWSIFLVVLLALLVNQFFVDYVGDFKAISRLVS